MPTDSTPAERGTETFRKVPKHIKEIAQLLFDDQNGPQWDAMFDYRISPNRHTGRAVMETILLRGAELHQTLRKVRRAE